MAKRIAMGLVFLLVAGCATRFTYQNYETVEYEMDKAQVRDILGKPGSEGEDQWVYEGKEKGIETEAYITFDDDGLVIDMEWPGDFPPED